MMLALSSEYYETMLVLSSEDRRQAVVTIVRKTGGLIIHKLSPTPTLIIALKGVFYY